MENKQHPEQELPLEDTPVFEELTFHRELSAQEIPLEEITPAPVEETISEPEDEILPEPAEAPAPEPVEAAGPGTAEEILPEPASQEAVLSEPPLSGDGSAAESIPEAETSVQELIPEAYTPEGPFDLSILDDPDLEIGAADAMEPLREVPQDFDFQASAQEFEELKKETPPPPPAPKREAPRIPQKGRPKRKKGEGLFGIPNMLVTVVWLALIVAIGVTAGRMLWICAADVLAFGREDKPVTITIYEADTMDDIVDKLHSAGLIRYKSLFHLYASISDAEEDIQPGIYDLNTRYDYHALVNFMSPRSSREVIKVTIPEGYSNRQIFRLLEENRICTAVDLARFATDGELDEYWFLEGLEKGMENRLEGYLFPDTYEFYKNSTPSEAIHKMLDNFQTRFTEEMRLQIDTLNANVTNGSFTVKEVIIVASLIEKESAAPGESPQIAGVIYNRLFNWEFPALLNIDAAIVYAQDGNAESIDTSLDSPYNTYLNQGLTPTPIANPGLSSIQAALNPDSHAYYYYVLNPSTGMHQFSTTQAEHDNWIAEFYGS